MKFEEFNLSKNADGLLPVVVQDCETLKVLMVAYMNEEAYQMMKILSQNNRTIAGIVHLTH